MAVVATLQEDLTHSEGLADPFMEVEYDPFQQTGTDWYNLMLGASLGGMPVHGVTLAATSETLAKQTENFAAKHTTGRIHFSDKEKDAEHASNEWYNKNLTGRSYHGTKTSNKARMLFDTGEWEPSQRIRAKSAAFVGALVATSGQDLNDAIDVASALAGEHIPEDAITRTELPMQIIKREAASVAKPNHVVYGHANAQQAITWSDAQLHADILPPTAALDWARVTTIARYIGEANCMVDDQFKHYAAIKGVPYALIKGSWAYVTSADYMLQPDRFAKIDVTAASVLPSSSLADAYTGHAENLYDAIHRMSNEIATGLVDPTLEALVRAAENVRKKTGTTKMATGTYVLSEPNRHQYGAEEVAETTRTSARSWDAFVTSLGELVNSNRTLKKAANDAVVASREKREYYTAIEPVLCEVCQAAVWQRSQAYLSNLLHNSTLATERIGKLKRSVLNNSAPIGVNCTLTNRIRLSATPQLMSALRLIIAGRVPELRIPVDARYGQDIKSLNQQRIFIKALNSHLKVAKAEWADRYTRLANAYGLSAGPGDIKKSVLFGSAAKAFAHMTGYLLTQVDTGFIEPDVLDTSYLVSIARGYVRKRHLNMPQLNSLIGKDAKGQAQELDLLLNPKVLFRDVEEFIRGKLEMFYSDIAAGKEPEDRESNETEAPTSAMSDYEQIDLAALEAEMALWDTAPTYEPTAQDVINSYDSEAIANVHAKMNGYDSFYEAYSALKTGARFDKESDYTMKALQMLNKKQQDENTVSANDMPSI